MLRSKKEGIVFIEQIRLLLSEERQLRSKAMEEHIAKLERRVHVKYDVICFSDVPVSRERYQPQSKNRGRKIERGFFQPT